MDDFKQYRRKQIAELADWSPGFDMTGVSVSDADKAAGSPKEGDKIARNPANPADRWLVAAAYFADNFEPASTAPDAGGVVDYPAKLRITELLRDEEWHDLTVSEQDSRRRDAANTIEACFEANNILLRQHSSADALRAEAERLREEVADEKHKKELAYSTNATLVKIKAQHEEYEKQSVHRDYFNSEYNKLRQRAEQAEAREAAMREDAERYRWLRSRVSGQNDELAPNGQDFVLNPPDVMDGQNIMKGSVAEHFDAAIDAARKDAVS